MTHEIQASRGGVVRRGTGTPVIFVHGNGVDHRILLEFDDVFARAGTWERVYVDLPGFGTTPRLPDPGGLPEVARWLTDAVDEVTDGRPFAVVGSSLGGLLVRAVVAQRRDRCAGMALLAPVVDPERSRRTLPPRTVVSEDPELMAALVAEDPDAAADYSDGAVVQSRRGWELFRRAVLPGRRAADLRAMVNLDRAYALPQHDEAQLDGFAAPVLVVAGLQDSVVGFADQAALASRYPHATFTLLDAAGHNVQFDQERVVRALLADWADRVLASTAAS